MPKPISAAEAAAQASVAGRPVPVRFVIVTLDHHLASATDRARGMLARELPGLSLTLHAAADWESDPAALERCRSDIESADFIVATMMFMDEHIQRILPHLQARRDLCDAMVGCMSSGEVVKLTRLGRLRMGETRGGPMALLKRLKPKKDESSTAGAQQMAMLRRLPKILRFVPGTAQDLRAYFLTLQYWLGGSETNVANLVRYLVDRYASGPRQQFRGKLKPQMPLEYPEIGVYHPRLRERIAERLDRLPGPVGESKGRVGLLIMRSYLLAGNAAHYDGVIAALEARGLHVVPAFASGLDGRPAIERFFMRDGAPAIDALVSLTGFSLVGGPAYNDARAAEEILAKLDVPYIAAHPAELQTLEQWASSDRGLLPVESTIMVALPELDGATGSIVFGGRSDHSGVCQGCERACSFPPGEDDRDAMPCPERAETLAARVERLVALRRSERAERRIGIVLFNFPPNAGATGTAAFLSVFGSLWRTLVAMRAAGYRVDLPADEDALRTALLEGNASRFGADANVHARIAVDDHVRREPHLAEIERQWGPAPGKQQTDGVSLHVLGERFGNVFVGVQPGFGYEGDPMRLLFEKGFAPTHAFSAFYRWLREDFKAHAVLHFGTHGALEFMPGKQAGLSAKCWPDRLIRDLPNLYLYAANNPSEGTLAKRRGAATLISYMTPPVTRAGLYRGLLDLKGSIERFRALEPEAARERGELAELIQAQAAQVELAPAEPVWNGDAAERIHDLTRAVHELETSLIPHGLHTVGVAVERRADRPAAGRGGRGPWPRAGAVDRRIADCR